MSDYFRPHESQHARPPCPSPTPGVHSDSHSSSQWCHPAISSSVVPFSSCPQSLPASESFPISQLFAKGGQSTGVSALASFLPKKSQGWSPSEWTGWISLQMLQIVFLIFRSSIKKKKKSKSGWTRNYATYIILKFYYATYINLTYPSGKLWISPFSQMKNFKCRWAMLLLLLLLLNRFSHVWLCSTP